MIATSTWVIFVALMASCSLWKRCAFKSSSSDSASSKPKSRNTFPPPRCFSDLLTLGNSSHSTVPCIAWSRFQCRALLSSGSFFRRREGHKQPQQTLPHRLSGTDRTLHESVFLGPPNQQWASASNLMDLCPPVPE